MQVHIRGSTFAITANTFKIHVVDFTTTTLDGAFGAAG